MILLLLIFVIIINYGEYPGNSALWKKNKTKTKQNKTKIKNKKTNKQNKRKTKTKKKKQKTKTKNKQTKQFTGSSRFAKEATNTPLYTLIHVFLCFVFVFIAKQVLWHLKLSQRLIGGVNYYSRYFWSNLQNGNQHPIELIHLKNVIILCQHWLKLKCIMVW